MHPILPILLTLCHISIVSAEITAPKSVPAGGTLEIQWTGGEVQPGGRFQVVTAEGEALKGGAYGYLHQPDQPVKLAAPLKPGTYGVVLAAQGAYHHLKTFTVTPVEATLKAPESVEMNAAFQVDWTGPSYSSDIIAIAKKGSNERTASYTHPNIARKKGKATVSLKAPLEPGEYDIIYRMKTEVLARTSIRVGGTEASVKVPTTVQAGGDLEVAWSGPDNHGDLISLVAVGAEARSAVYRYTAMSTSNRLLLTVPEELGKYEVVYFTGGKPLARAPIAIVDVSATLEAPAEVIAGQAFEVAWTGPGNRKDLIAMMPQGEKPQRPYAAHHYVIKEEPTLIYTAPAIEGAYTLHYLTRETRVLAERPINVTPAPTEPGFLKVIANQTGSFGENSALEIILDASGSMLKRQGDRRRIEIAKESILSLLEDVIPAGTGFALRVFGHKEADSCRTDLEMSLGPLDPAAAKLKVASIQAMNLAKTPIADSLAHVASDLQGVTGERIVILVTDGEETCEGDPALAIRELRSAGSDVRVNIVGYAIDEAALQETFASWAALGGGQYLHAPNAEQLSKAMRQALAIPFEVYANDQLVATSITGAPQLKLAAGTYQIRYRRDNQDLQQDVRIEQENVTEMRLP